MVFYVSGYWKDDKSEFDDFIITEWDCVPEGFEDEDIFYYGLSETDLSKSNEEDDLEFVITHYKKIDGY